MSEPALLLSVGNADYGGWKSARVTRGLEQLGGTFDLTVTDKWAGQSISRPIAAGSPCTLKLDGKTVITGFVNAPHSHRDAEDHAITFKGDDRTCDLVDCVIPGPPYYFTQMKLEKLIANWCKPFGIGVSVKTDTGSPLPAFSINPEKKAMEALAYLARIRGVLLMSDGLGNLLLTESGTSMAPTAIEMGKNALVSDGGTDLRNRHSVYHVYSQLVQADVAAMSAESMNMSGMATDPLMTRFRPIALQSESSVDLKYAQRRALWERNTRAARSQQVTHTVLGWSHKSGLWEPNTLVSVTDADFQMNKQIRLISRVTYTWDEKGARTEITHVGRYAYDKLTEPADQLLMNAQL